MTMNIKTLLVAGFQPALKGMRNPKNSWNKIDSIYYDTLNPTIEMVNHKYIDEAMKDSCIERFLIGDNDMKLAQTLIKAGNEHMKFMRMIHVWADMNMTRFFWSEMDTYHFNTKNSCSTMHKLLNPQYEVTLDMFEYYEEDEEIVINCVNQINQIREEFLNTKDYETQSKLKRRAKTLLFDGFLQLRTVDTNYAEIRNILLQRKNHQMKKDWQDTFCRWSTTLPYAKELIFCGIEDLYDKFKVQ